MKLAPKAKIQILKPIEEVFEGIVDHKKMTNYFISESTGRMEQGKEVNWKFPEFKETFPVKVTKVAPPHSVSFVWEPETEVRITLEEYDNNSTIVRITEESKDFNEENVKWALNNTEGWANFLACLKAYLEYGIKLRKGAFEFLGNKKQQ